MFQDTFLTGNWILKLSRFNREAMKYKKLKDCLLCEARIAVILDQKKCTIHKNCFNHRHSYNFQISKYIYHTKFPKISVFIASKSFFCFFCQKLLKKKLRKSSKKTICSCIVKRKKT
jgi:hypothetical protein